jgi:hypothetical protein
MTGCRFQDIWKDQCEAARGVPAHLTALAELRTTKLAGGDIRLPTYSRPTRSGSANVDSSSAISRSSTAMYVFGGAPATPSGTPGACIRTGPLIETHSIVGILSDVVEPILILRSKLSFH